MNVELAFGAFHADIPETRSPAIVEIGVDHDRPLKPLGAVIGEHMHGITGRHYGLQVELG